MNYKPKKVNNFLLFLGGLARGVFGFFSRIRKCFSVMTVFERRAITLLFAVLLILVFIKANDYYKEITKEVPGYGGNYQEAIFGELKYINPVLVSNDADRATSELIFSGLVRYDKDNNILPEVASKWEVSPDGLQYAFALKDNVFFHDGEKLTSQDIIYTVAQIQNPDLRSPMYETFKDVDITADGDSKVIFALSRAYGPFIYNCDFGILPDHVNLDDFSKKPIGTGPYKFASTKKENNRIVSLSLIENKQYYKSRPYISTIKLDFFADKNKTISAFVQSQDTALAAGAASEDQSTDMSFPTSKRLALIFNLRGDRLKDKAFREQVLNGTRFEPATNLTLTTLDSDLQKQKAEELKNKFKDQNIDLTIKYCNPVDMKTVLDKKDYELLLYGFDFGHDRDPYIFWHSTQISKNNFAGYSDKNSDILLEDARLMSDGVARNQKYDQFFTAITAESIIQFFDPIKYDFRVKNTLHGVEVITGNDAESRYYNIEKWYLKEGRVKK